MNLPSPSRKFILTVASIFGRFLSRGCFPLISSCMTTVSKKNYPQGLPPKHQGTTFGAIKISGKKILIGNLTGSELEMTTADHISDCLGVWGIRLVS